jgi:hypothetical protein
LEQSADPSRSGRVDPIFDFSSFLLIPPHQHLTNTSPKHYQTITKILRTHYQHLTQTLQKEYQLIGLFTKPNITNNATYFYLFRKMLPYTKTTVTFV